MAALTPALIQIHRETVNAGAEAAYDAIETDTARACAALGCPHPYLALEAVSGSREVWFLNGFASVEEQQAVVKAYAGNAPLMAALQRNSDAKRALTITPIGGLATHRPDATRGASWALGIGRFLIVTVSNAARLVDGTVFETEGTRVIVTSANTRDDADAAAVRAGTGSHVLAVRPAWSFPAAAWIAADPALWARSGR